MSARAAAARDLRRRLGRNLIEHQPIKDLSPLGVGGVADFYYPATTLKELMTAVQAARAVDMPWVVIGGGTRSLMSDYGFAGLVIANQTKGVTFVPGRGQVIAESGTTWPELILGAAGRGLAGLSSLLLLSGTIGGTLASGVSTPETDPCWAVRQLTILDSDGSVRQIKPRDLRKSRFQSYLILSVIFQFIEMRPDVLTAEIRTYERLRRRFAADTRHYLGPILSVRGYRRPFAVTELLTGSRSLTARVGNAFFSRQRLNYIEIRGRTTARELRTLITQIYDFVSSENDDSFDVHVRFIGNWEEV